MEIAQIMSYISGARCDFQFDTSTLSSTPFPSEAAFPYLQDFCFVFKKITRVCSMNPYRRKLFEEKYPGTNVIKPFRGLVKFTIQYNIENYSSLCEFY
jgi:hypothetical protein